MILLARRVFAGVLVVAALAPEACSSPDKLRGQGATCFESTDCQSGLACVPQSNGMRVCTSDLGPTQMLPPMNGGADAAAPHEAGEAAAMEGGSPQDDATTPPDAGGPPAEGGGPMPDAGGPAPDAGGPADAGPADAPSSG